MTTLIGFALLIGWFYFIYKVFPIALEVSKGNFERVWFLVAAIIAVWFFLVSGIIGLVLIVRDLLDWYQKQQEQG